MDAPTSCTGQRGPNPGENANGDTAVEGLMLVGNDTQRTSVMRWQAVYRSTLSNRLSILATASVGIDREALSGMRTTAHPTRLFLWWTRRVRSEL